MGGDRLISRRELLVDGMAGRIEALPNNSLKPTPLRGAAQLRRSAILIVGLELHITRAGYWAENDDASISAEEWLAYVSSDDELELWPENGPYFARWRGESAHEEPWLNWSSGNVDSKWPDTALYRKMLGVALALSAKVQDDDGVFYENEGDWQFDSHASRSGVQSGGKPWWKRLFS
jgi:hypothetical protein